MSNNILPENNRHWIFWTGTVIFTLVAGLGGTMYASQQLARRKFWYRSWCDENPEKVKYFTFFDYLQASLNGMTRIYLAFEEKQNEDRVSH